MGIVSLSFVLLPHSTLRVVGVLPRVASRCLAALSCWNRVVQGPSLVRSKYSFAAAAALRTLSLASRHVWYTALRPSVPAARRRIDATPPMLSALRRGGLAHTPASPGAPASTHTQGVASGTRQVVCVMQTLRTAVRALCLQKQSK